MLNRAEFRGGVFALALVVVGLLLLVWLSPGLPGELLLQSLRFHILALGAVLAIALIVLGARWRGVVLLLLMLAGGLHAITYMRDYLARRPPIYQQAQGEVDFLSFNVLADNRSPTKLVDAILANPPDVALIMESGGLEPLFSRLETVLPYRSGCEGGGTCDISLHSSVPLENVQLKRLPPFQRQRLVSAKVTIDGQTFTIVGVHLSKPYFDEASWVELTAIGRFLNTIEGPVILAGDFNSAPWSEPLAALAAKQGLAVAGWPPATWPVEFGPFGVPIDNMFSRGTARIKTLEAGEPLGSNHRSLRAKISVYDVP